MIVAETEYFWVLNKPEGIAINDDDNSPGFISSFKAEMGVDAHPVHRLDKATSGLMLVAKDSKMNQVLSGLFQKQSVSKTYLAIIRTRPGIKPKKKQGWIKGDMEKSRGGSWKLLSSNANPARTYFDSVSLGERRRLCLVKPVTGKTHQIRVALKSLSMPIVGDERYGGDEADRMYLHAMSLSFELFGELYSYSLRPASGGLFQALSESDILSLENPPI